MTEYVDGFVLAVPKRNVAAYRKMAAHAGRIWIAHGALAFRECVADDMPKGLGTVSFALFAVCVAAWWLRSRSASASVQAS